MKTFISVLLAIACLAILIVGNLHWNEKTSISAHDTAAQDSGKDVGIKNNTADTSSMETLLSYTKNWPAESVATFKDRVQNEKPFKIAFLGSLAQGEEEESWPQMVKTALAETFGDHISVSTFGYDVTSAEFVEQDMQADLVKEKPDLVLFEPFTLKDNGEVEIDDSLANVSSIMDAVQSENPDTVFILQPPHPLYNATFYPIQVERLKNYAEAEGIVYLDHWEAWPDYTTEEINDYLSEDQSEPSTMGHEVWAKYVTDYLIAGK